MTDISTPVPANTTLGKIIAGYLASFAVLLDSAGGEVLGQLTASPDANSIGGRLKAILTALGTPMQAGGAVTVSGTPTVNLGTIAGVATDATLTAILTKLGQQRQETLWTDDTGAFFVRVDNAGTINWTDTSGNASSAPGTGSRPAAGSSVLLDKSAFVATAGGTGFSIGDYLDHLVTTDPQSGAVLGNFWINVSTNAKLASAPASGSISPVSVMPPGAASAAKQDAQLAVGTEVYTLADGSAGLAAGAATATVTVTRGGYYFFDAGFGGTSPLLKLQRLGADGQTWIDVMTRTAIGSGDPVGIPSQSQLRLLNAGTNPMTVVAARLG